jgi:hypothetical protein
MPASYQQKLLVNNFCGQDGLLLMDAPAKNFQMELKDLNLLLLLLLLLLIDMQENRGKVGENTGMNMYQNQ